MGQGTRDDVARMGPPCLAQATSRRYVRALLLASTLSFGLPFACCADDGAGCTREDGAIASASGDRSNPRVGFAVPAREMSEAGLAGEGIGARPPPLVSFGAVEAGFKRNGDRGIDRNKDLENNNRDRLNQKTATGSGAALGGDGGVAAGGSGGASSVGIASAGDSFISFTSKNSYPDITWSPWSHLAEPHRETTLRADSTLGDLDNDVFVWTMPGENGASFEGREIHYTFTETGIKQLILTQTVVSTGELYHLDAFVVVKYVRREIRQLQDADRETFFDAMETLYRLSTAEGVHLYGDEYKGIDFFVQLHLDGAGTKDCDHWHDDSGIMTHHVAYTLQFEQALQLVDPSVSIPYWEYTIESAMGLDSYGDSEVFAKDWFGEFNPTNELHTVVEGRWAYLPVMEDAWDYVHNSYGLLRSPWNLDSTPYVTRHNTTSGSVPTTLVSCSTYSDCFESSSFSVMNACLNGETHGPVHILIGGEWGAANEEFIEKVGFVESVPMVSKYLWRKGYLRIPDSCTVGEGECLTSCPSHLYEAQGMTPYDVLMDVHALMWLAHTTGGALVYNSDTGKFEIKGHEDDEDFQHAFWKKMLESLCNPGHVGEMFTSAAPYDPLFWVVHPTSDRLLGWRRMLGRDGTDGYDFDETWGYRHATVVGESGTVCSWEQVMAGTNDMPTCTVGTCGGHNEDDVLPFNVKINGAHGTYTNAEWMELIYPTNIDLPYMYDGFGWDQCSSEGYTFGV